MATRPTGAPRRARSARPDRGAHLFDRAHHLWTWLRDHSAVDDAEQALDALTLSPGERTARIAVTVGTLALDFALLLGGIGLLFGVVGVLFDHVDILAALFLGLLTSSAVWFSLRRPRCALEAWVLGRIHDRAVARRALEDRGASGALSRGGSAVAVPVDAPIIRGGDDHGADDDEAAP